MQTNINKIPVTIITGFLGTGKTSFINKTLKYNQGINFAIIENEFGEISVDNELLTEIDQNQIYNITNGCICCTNHLAFIDLLDNYLNTFKKFDHLIIETTGIAEPDNIILSFLNHYGFQLNFTLHNVICIVDAKNYFETLGSFKQQIKQIALSDTTIINKTDLVDSNELKLIRESILTVNSSTHIFEASFGHSPEFDWNMNRVFNFNQISEKISKTSTLKTQHDLVSITISINEMLDINKLVNWIEKLINNDPKIIRIKGIVFSNVNPQKLIIQTVRKFLLITPLKISDQENKTSNIVFIGIKLNKKEITESIKKFSVNAS